MERGEGVVKVKVEIVVVGTAQHSTAQQYTTTLPSSSVIVEVVVVVRAA